MGLASFTANNLNTVLRMMAPAGRYWTLHGGGALVFYMRHRLLSELDLFIDRDQWDDSAPRVTAECLRPLASTEIMDKIKKDFPADNAQEQITKVKCEKIEFSFVYTPRRNCVITKKITNEGMLPVASLMDVLGGKIDAIHNRNKFNDYFDMATALGRGHRLETMLKFLLISLTPAAKEKMDFSLPFRKMIAPPEFIGSNLSDEHKKLLKEAGEFGLTLIKDSAFIR